MKWHNDRTGLATTLDADPRGDMNLFQIPKGSQETVDQSRRIFSDSTPWQIFLSHLFLFCLQADFPLPFKDDWEKRFYRGSFEARWGFDDASMLLKRLMDEGTDKPRLRLPMEGLSSFDEERMKKMRGDIALMQILSREKLIFPYITKEKDLAYIASPLISKEKIILLGREDIVPAFEETIAQCFERGLRHVPGAFYKAFPFQKPYNEVFPQ